MNNQKKIFGLIGNPVKHSFSKIYFEQKFNKLGITDCEYKLFELKSINDLAKLLKNEPYLQGFNVTSPFKQSILQYLHTKSKSVNIINACNCVKINNGTLNGYNTDFIGFIKSLKESINISQINSALILGTGGAAKAIAYGLFLNNIAFSFVSTQTKLQSQNTIAYSDLSKCNKLQNFDLIVNATPCGMDGIEPIKSFPYHLITNKHIVMDLIYNPKETFLLSKAKQQNAITINGLKMLQYQADESFEIWFNNKK